MLNFKKGVKGGSRRFSIGDKRKIFS